LGAFNSLKPLTAFVKIVALFVVLFLAPAATHAQEGFETAEILFTRAILAYGDGNYAEATDLLLQAHKLNAGHIDVIYYLGLSYNAQGNFDEAARYLREGLAREPENSVLRYELGIALYGQNKFDEALKEFLPIFEAEPRMDNLGYYIGLCYSQKKDYETAVGYFRKNVSTDAKTRQLNQKSLGLALQALGREAEARQELDEAIKIAPAGPIVGSTQQLLTAVREQTGGKRLRIEVTFNAQFDSNPEAQHRERKSYGNLLNVKADYTVFKSGPWESTATYSLLQTLNYENHRGDLNDNFIGANLYYKTIIAGMPSIAGLQLNNDILFLDKELYLQRPTGTLTLTVQENLSNTTTALFRPQYKDFLQGTTTHDEHRNAMNEMVGFIHYIRFADGKYQINFGYNWDHEDARGHNWRYNGHKAIAGLQVGLPWQIQWTTNFEFHARFYPGQNSNPVFLQHQHRKDQEATVLTTLTKDLAQNLTLTLQGLRDRNYSTIPDFNYSRYVTALGLTWRY
jgi:tetratricopeptide (TPR) repeat protein